MSHLQPTGAGGSSVQAQAYLSDYSVSAAGQFGSQGQYQASGYQYPEYIYSGARQSGPSLPGNTSNRTDDITQGVENMRVDGGNPGSRPAAKREIPEELFDVTK
jgi:hypothetical protein